MKHVFTIHKTLLMVATFFACSFVWSQTGNTIQGLNAGTSITTGVRNSFFGEYAGHSTDTGYRNSFFGYNSGYNNTSGWSNSFFGHRSGFSNTEGNWNVFLGRFAGRENTTGSFNVFVGAKAGRDNITGTNNVFVGHQSGYENTVGSNNVFLGYRTGYNETGSDKLYIDNSNTSSPLIYGDFSSNELQFNGTVGIDLGGGTIPAGYKLAVDGKIIAEEIKVKLSQNWPDYVFTPEHQKPTLEELEASIETNGYLPNMPSAEEVETNGYLLGEMDVKLLEKIEELTLYVIDLNKEIQAVKAKNAELEASLKAIGQ